MRVLAAKHVVWGADLHGTVIFEKPRLDHERLRSLVQTLLVKIHIDFRPRGKHFVSHIFLLCLPWRPCQQCHWAWVDDYCSWWQVAMDPPCQPRCWSKRFMQQDWSIIKNKCEPLKRGGMVIESVIKGTAPEKRSASIFIHK
jgi:hypothetical protein